MGRALNRVVRAGSICEPGVLVIIFPESFCLILKDEQV